MMVPEEGKAAAEVRSISVSMASISALKVVEDPAPTEMSN